MTTLLSYVSAQDGPLADALQHCRSVLEKPPAIALLYAPSWCRFGLLNNTGYLCAPDGSPIDLGPVYEARIFNRDVELRWLNESGGEGKSVVLSEAEHQIPGYGPPESIDFIKAIAQTYLLWGIAVERRPGSDWSTLTSARIGGLDVPLDEAATLAGSNPNSRVRVLLEVKEYLRSVDTHGNVAVCEERLRALTPRVIGQPQTESSGAAAKGSTEPEVQHA